jgi:hypothetical protein
MYDMQNCLTNIINVKHFTKITGENGLPKYIPMQYEEGEKEEEGRGEEEEEEEEAEEDEEEEEEAEEEEEEEEAHTTVQNAGFGLSQQ